MGAKRDGEKGREKELGDGDRDGGKREGNEEMKGEEKVRQGEWRRKGEKERETEVGGGREGEAASEGTRMKGQENRKAPSPSAKSFHKGSVGPPTLSGSARREL